MLTLLLCLENSTKTPVVTCDVASETTLTSPFHTDRDKPEDSLEDTEHKRSDDRKLRAALASQEYVPKTNMEEERRAAARMLFTLIQHETLGSNNTLVLCVSEAILILHLARWEWTRAVRMAADIAETRALLSVRFDHMRTTADAIDRDERLATMLQITQRSDWHSVQKFLASHKWDLIKAIVAWYKKGIEVVRHPKDKAGTQGEGMGRRKDLSQKPLPLPCTNDTTPDKQQCDVDWAAEPQEYVQTGSIRIVKRPTSTVKNGDKKPGFMLDDDPTPVQKGVKKPSKLCVEYISKGDYRQNVFKHKKFNWTGASDDDRPPFDWDKQEHLEALNSFRRQTRQRNTFVTRREPGQKFSQDELDFLYDLSERHVQKLMKNNPGHTRTDLLPFTVSADLKESWLKAFNKKFAGKKFGIHKKPLKPRNINALMTQRHRYKKLQEDFRLKPDSYMSARREQREKRKRNLSDRADNSNGEESVDGSGSEGE